MCTRFVFPLNFPEYAICLEQHSEVNCVPKTTVSCQNNSQHEADCNGQFYSFTENFQFFFLSEKVYKAAPLPMDKPEDTCKAS
ncbi:hypothetical protein CAEBREN_22576 [Caenorhabditis brenneri]|uniref:Uncharacterized protein n=1 Tax=Caenorhabditis brenneri TaxID=135651 RepID=G0NI91_CAEBE|nr:hypothetical protein CAEBREN_22576 [Caenorhabditis brenneri]